MSSPEAKQLLKRVLTDSNGNQAMVSTFGTLKQAQEALDSLEGCTNCTNCFDCINCHNCHNCSYCDSSSNLREKVDFINNSDTSIFITEPYNDEF